MTEDQIRLACLKLARPDATTDPDADAIMRRAEKFLAFVMKAGAADKPKGPARQSDSRPSTGR